MCCKWGQRCQDDNLEGIESILPWELDEVNPNLIPEAIYFGKNRVRKLVERNKERILYCDGVKKKIKQGNQKNG